MVVYLPSRHEAWVVSSALGKKKCEHICNPSYFRGSRGLQVQGQFKWVSRTLSQNLKTQNIAYGKEPPNLIICTIIREWLWQGTEPSVECFSRIHKPPGSVPSLKKKKISFSILKSQVIACLGQSFNQCTMEVRIYE